MSWNYRVIEHATTDDDPWCAIHEVYYADDGTPTYYSAEPAPVACGEGAGGDHLGWVLDRMREALDKPALTEGDFGGEAAPVTLEAAREAALAKWRGENPDEPWGPDADTAFRDGWGNNGLSVPWLPSLDRANIAGRRARSFWNESNRRRLSR